MIDIHSHILFGIDDGAADLEASIKMAQQAYIDGVTDIIATPHYIKGSYENTADIIIAKTAVLNRELKKMNIDVKIYPGAELYLDIDLLDDLFSKKLMSLNHSMYVLIEFPFQSIPRGTDELIFKLLVNKYIPIIAHPERNSEFLRKPEKLYGFIEKGALVQMNAGSLLGDFGSSVAKLSRVFLQNKFVNFVGSDAHHYEGRNSKLTKWIEEAAKYVGIDYATDMVTKFPKKIIDSIEIEFPEPVMLENSEQLKSGFLKKFLDQFLG